MFKVHLYNSKNGIEAKGMYYSSFFIVQKKNDVGTIPALAYQQNAKNKKMSNVLVLSECIIKKRVKV